MRRLSVKWKSDHGDGHSNCHTAHYKDLHTNTQVSAKAGTTLQRPAYKHTGIRQSWDYTTKTCIKIHRYPLKLGLHYKDLHKDTQVSAKAGTTLQRPAYKHTGIRQSWDYTTKTCIKIHRYPLKLGLHYKDLHKDTQVSAKAGTTLQRPA